MSTSISTADARVLALARARQQLAHDGTGYVPAWEDLADAEREQALTAARGWLAAAIEAGLLPDITEADGTGDITAGDNTEPGTASA